jgi:hypothetical protein
VYDLWTHRWRRKATGDVIVIRYADDAIVGFQHEHEAKALLHDLQQNAGVRTGIAPDENPADAPPEASIMSLCDPIG